MAEAAPPEAKTSMPGKRHRMVGYGVLAAPFAAALAYGLWSLSVSDRYYGDLDAYGVETGATVLAKRVVRSGTDRPRHHYQMTVGFTVGETMRRGAVEVTRDFYERHDPPQRVSIRYLPADPQIREIDPAMRGKSGRKTLTIVALLLFIGFVNLGMARRARPERPTARRKMQ